MFTSVIQLQECQRMGSSRFQILLPQIYIRPGSPSVADGICIPAAPWYSCNHTWNICIYHGLTDETDKGKVEGGTMRSKDLLMSELKEILLLACLPRRVLLFHVNS